MPAPTAYTEATLATFMLAELGDVAGVLGWTTQDAVQEAINEALLVYGVDDIADATDIPKLRALARRQAWRSAVNSLTTRYDFTNPEGEYKRSQMVKAAATRLAQVESDAMPYDQNFGAAVVTTVTASADPYTFDASEWAVPA